MKKTLLTLTLGLAASVSSFAAPCTNGETLANLAGCNIAFANGGSSWNFSVFGSDTLVASGYSFGGNTAAAGYVRATWSAVNVGGAEGFKMVYTPSGVSPSVFAASTNQQVAFNTNFSVVANNAASAITQYAVSIDGYSSTPATSGVQPSTVVNKSLISGGSTQNNYQADQSNLLRAYKSVGSTNGSSFSVVDAYQLNAGENGGSASSASYTNYFLPNAPSNGVPEPMSFVLMGAGLVGIAALRRRS